MGAISDKLAEEHLRAKLACITCACGKMTPAKVDIVGDIAVRERPPDLAAQDPELRRLALRTLDVIATAETKCRLCGHREKASVRCRLSKALIDHMR